jgi:hypothetical protein
MRGNSSQNNSREDLHNVCRVSKADADNTRAPSSTKQS